jgi:predicted phosphodiesterase
MQFSDVHVGNPVNRPVHRRLEAAVALANSLRPVFVIDTGDMTTHPVYDANAANLAEYGEYKRYTKPLTMPLYNVPGNHDIGYFDPGGRKRKDGKPWGDYTALVAAYKKELGPLDRSFCYRGIRFILINNNPPASRQPGHLSTKQLTWIESELKRGDTEFIFCHVQVLRDGTGPPWGESAERLAALCKMYHVAAVAYGHQHQQHVKTRHGTHYIMCPDLKMPDHQAVLQYRVFRDHFELWIYDVFSQRGRPVGSYRYPCAAATSPCP